MEENLRKFDEEKQKELEAILAEQKIYEKQEKNKKLNEWKVRSCLSLSELIKTLND